MQSFQSDLKYIREALNLLIDKLLPYIEQKQILQFCKVLKNKIADDKVTPFSIYMETQKNFEGSQTKPVRLNSTSDEKFTNSVLSKLKLAQTEFKNNTQQFASIYNSVKENVESVYVTSQELQIMMNEKQIQMQNKAEQRQDQIRRVSIYSKQNKQKTDTDVQEEKPKEYKIEIKSVDKNVIKSDTILFQLIFIIITFYPLKTLIFQTICNKIGSKNDLKLETKGDINTDFKYSFEGSRRDLFSTQEQIPNQRITPTNQQQGQIKVEKPLTQQSPLCYQQLKPQNIVQTPNNYPKTSPNSYTQLPLQKNSQTTPFTYVQQSSLGQIMYTQSDQKQTSQMGSYVPNYDLLARVDQLLQKTKIGTQAQNNIPCLTNRI